MIQINNNNGTIVVGNPPFKKWRKGWSKKLRIGRLYFYISNCRLKKRAKRDLLFTGFRHDHYVENKHKLYERQGGSCPHCGKHVEYDRMENHHILPVSRFPELQFSIRNSIMLCNHCHKEVHINPWRNIQLMREKAEELGIDLSEHFKMYELEETIK